MIADATAELTRWAAPDRGQEALREEFLAHLASHPDGWSRECPGAHLTASALISSADASRVLLVHHRKLQRWLQTGGHIEAGDTTVAGAALREAGEESGLTGLRVAPGILHLDRHEVPCGPVRPCYHLDVRFLVFGDPEQEPPGSAESNAVAWFDAQNLPTGEPSVTALVTAAETRLRR